MPPCAPWCQKVLSSCVANAFLNALRNYLVRQRGFLRVLRPRSEKNPKQKLASTIRMVREICSHVIQEVSTISSSDCIDLSSDTFLNTKGTGNSLILSKKFLIAACTCSKLFKLNVVVFAISVQENQTFYFYCFYSLLPRVKVWVGCNLYKIYPCSSAADAKTLSKRRTSANIFLV